MTPEIMQQSIENAIQHKSKLSAEAITVPALSSIYIRHLLNNLASHATIYLECGVHKGGTFCSAVFGNDNLLSATAVDCFTSEFEDASIAEREFKANSEQFAPPNTQLRMIKKDAFAVTKEDIPLLADMYLYDAGHSEEQQYDALMKYLPFVTDTFMFLVDDYDWNHVRIGTERAIKDSGVEVLYFNHLRSVGLPNDSWWNGYGVYLLHKK